MSNKFITAPENNKERFKIAKTKLIRKHVYMSFRGKDYNKRLKFAEIPTRMSFFAIVRFMVTFNSELTRLE